MLGLKDSAMIFEKKIGLKIIIFGINRYTSFVLSSIRSENTILGVSDSYSILKKWGEYKFIVPLNILDYEVDYIVVTARERRVCREIDERLSDLGVSPERIINFFEIFHEEKVEKVFKRHPEKEADGLILGLSHAAKGINPNCLDGEWINLATTSEDIYYHFEVVKKYAKKYVTDYEKLKYIIIDMYDYYVLSYDTSMSAGALTYWADGGNAELHNYFLNSVYKNDIERELTENMPNYPAYYTLRKQNEMIVRQRIFEEEFVYERIGEFFYDIDPGHLGYEDFPNELHNRGHVEKNPMLPSEAYMRHCKQSVRYEKTEMENKQCFDKMIGYILEMFPNVKIFLVMLPRYEAVESLHRENTYILEEKRKFEDFISKYVDKRRVFYLNFKGTKEITENSFFWRDAAHLNYQGSIAMTTIIDECMHQ